MSDSLTKMVEDMVARARMQGKREGSLLQMQKYRQVAGESFNDGVWTAMLEAHDELTHKEKADDTVSNLAD